MKNTPQNSAITDAASQLGITEQIHQLIEASEQHAVADHMIAASTSLITAAKWVIIAAHPSSTVQPKGMLQISFNNKTNRDIFVFQETKRLPEFLTAVSVAADPHDEKRALIYVPLTQNKQDIKHAHKTSIPQFLKKRHGALCENDIFKNITLEIQYSQLETPTIVADLAPLEAAITSSSSIPSETAEKEATLNPSALSSAPTSPVLSSIIDTVITAATIEKPVTPPLSAFSEKPTPSAPSTADEKLATLTSAVTTANPAALNLTTQPAPTSKQSGSLTENDPQPQRQPLFSRHTADTSTWQRWILLGKERLNLIRYPRLTPLMLGVAIGLAMYFSPYSIAAKILFPLAMTHLFRLILVKANPTSKNSLRISSLAQLEAVNYGKEANKSLLNYFKTYTKPATYLHYPSFRYGIEEDLKETTSKRAKFP